MNVHLVFATPENILFLFVLLSRVCFESLIEKAASPLSSSFVSHSRFCSSDPCCCTTPSYDVFLLKRSMFNLVRTSLVIYLLVLVLEEHVSSSTISYLYFLQPSLLEKSLSRIIERHSTQRYRIFSIRLRDLPWHVLPVNVSRI